MNLILILISTFCTVSALALPQDFGHDCAALVTKPTSSTEPATVFGPGDIVVEKDRGLIQVIEIDHDNDRLTGKSLDSNYYKQFKTRFRSTKYRRGGFVPFITNFKNKEIYRVSTPESSALIKRRIESRYGISTIKNYFALYRLIELIDQADSRFYYKSEFRHYLGVLTENKKPIFNTLNDFTEVVFAKQMTPEIEQALVKLTEITGQDPTRAGILSTLALRPSQDNDRFEWPMMRINPDPNNNNPISRGSAENIKHENGRYTKVKTSVPVDVDHYSRSWLWDSQTQPADLIPIKQIDANEHTLVFNIGLGDDHQSQNERDGVRIEIEASKSTIDEDLHDRTWVKLFNVATSKIKMPNVYGKDVVFVVPTDLENGSILTEELRSIAWYAGAKSVKTYVVR